MESPRKVPEGDRNLMRRNGVEVRAFARGALLVDMSTGKCYRLNKTGAEVWNMLAEPCAFAEVCLRLALRYQEPISKVEIEVSELLDALAREHLLGVDGEGS